MHHLFSSGICTPIICRGSRHCTTQPCLSLTRAVSTDRKVLGILLHSTDTIVWTSSRGGHWGSGVFCKLLKMAEDRGIASCVTIDADVSELQICEPEELEYISSIDLLGFLETQTGRGWDSWVEQTQQGIA